LDELRLFLGDDFGSGAFFLAFEADFFGFVVGPVAFFLRRLNFFDFTLIDESESDSYSSAGSVVNNLTLFFAMTGDLFFGRQTSLDFAIAFG
jgi:hypothetical protein